MTKLEQAHYDAIKNLGTDYSAADSVNSDTWADNFNKHSAGTKSAAITIAHMKGFAEWLRDKNESAYFKASNDFKSTEELIELYLNQTK